MTQAAELQEKLFRLARKWKTDPLEFARKAFPWGQGTLAGMTGPDEWQTKVLAQLTEHIKSGASTNEVFRLAVASGHGVGKSSCVAWLILWAMSTCADTRGVVTANTENQLRTKTWPELAKWFSVCIFQDWFELTATAIFAREKGHDKTWRIDAIPWSESSTESFAGLHNKGKRIIVIFDEASSIIDRIWEVTEGAMTDADTQIMWCCFGNPTRNTGRFFECFNRFRHRWIHMHVDSRTAAASNKQLIGQWLEDYGEESDFFKTRVRGVFPSASAMQFIDRASVDAAVQRTLEHVDYTRQVAVVGVDAARFGDDSSVIFTRIGLDAKSIQKEKFRGLDGWELGAKVAEHYNRLVRDYHVPRVIINVDGGGIGASPVDWLKKNGYPVNEILFGKDADDKHKYRNKRAEMWGRMRDWLKGGGCIADDQDLISDLTGVEYDYTPAQQIILERKDAMKARGLHSPDDADALALTFAVNINEYLLELEPMERFRSHRERTTRDPYA